MRTGRSARLRPADFKMTLNAPISTPSTGLCDAQSRSGSGIIDGFREFVADAKRQKKPHRDADVVMERTLGLVDLLLLGVGGTLGSGLFLLAGRAARDVAGPAVSLSFIVAAIACIFSGLSYAEMASRFPMSGGAYSFAYSALGEFPAFLVGMCLTLEYGVSSAAVARAWAAYVGQVVLWLPAWAVGRGADWCVLGFALMVAISALIGAGMKETKWVINGATSLYAIVVAIIIFVGIPRVDPSNWVPFVPYGSKSVLTGASVVFFSYVGFDEVATVAEEAKNPSITAPLAILGSLIIVTVLYVASTLVLTGMVKYSNIDFEAPFPAAFRAAGYSSLASVIGIGVAIGMANTALVGILAQTRLFLALSQDGLIPRSLGANVRRSTAVCGIIVSLLALVVPTQSLTDVVSGGTLIAFLCTNISLILTRYKLIPGGPRRVSSHVYVFVVGCLLCGCAVRIHSWSPLNIACYALSFGLILISAWFIISENMDTGSETEHIRPAFQCPMVPLVPLLGSLTTSILFTQLSHKALMALALWLVLSSLMYCMYGRFNSFANDVGPVPNERTAVNGSNHGLRNGA